MAAPNNATLAADLAIALYQLKITGTLNDATDSNGSSGAAYKEGDLVNLSKFTAEAIGV